jgi:hypothetical protein
MTTRKREPTFGEALNAIRDEHTENLTRAIAALVRFPGVKDSENAIEANRIAKSAVQQATAATATAYMREYERKDAERAQAKQDRNMRLLRRPGSWGKE